MGAANANRRWSIEQTHSRGSRLLAVWVWLAPPQALCFPSAHLNSEKQVLRVGVSNSAACVVKKELVPFPRA